LGFQAGINFYPYVGNNPTNYADPTGNCPHCLFGGVVGGVVGLVSEGASQLAAGNFDGAKLVGATVGGAVTGVIIAATGGASLLAVGGAAATGGLSGNLTSQGINNITGVQQGINTGDLVQATLISGIAGPIGSKIPLPLSGITAGRNSFSAIAKSTTTKLRNGTIQNISTQTFGKAIVAETVASSPSQIIGNSSNFAIDSLTNSGASGGFVLYPSKPNLNMMSRVYSK
jgi:hypothetical protein